MQEQNMHAQPTNEAPMNAAPSGEQMPTQSNVNSKKTIMVLVVLLLISFLIIIGLLLGGLGNNSGSPEVTPTSMPTSTPSPTSTIEPTTVDPTPTKQAYKKLDIDIPNLKTEAKVPAQWELSDLDVKIEQSEALGVFPIDGTFSVKYDDKEQTDLEDAKFYSKFEFEFNGELSVSLNFVPNQLRESIEDNSGAVQVKSDVYRIMNGDDYIYVTANNDCLDNNNSNCYSDYFAFLKDNSIALSISYPKTGDDLELVDAFVVDLLNY